ncbi:MAG TPA: glycosyltransferase family 39 protein [Vicinamibacterales bacterium]|nr:glycosyltransferase family 39 protein [Vicinamibacterales bacterium]
MSTRVSGAAIVSAAIASLIVLRLGGATWRWLPGTLTLAAALIAVAVATRAAGRWRTWRPFARRHAFALALAGAVLLAFVARVPGLNGELGHQPLDVDENRLATNVKQFFVKGDLNHDTVEHYPGAVFWMFSGASFIGYMHQLTSGAVVQPAHIPVDMFVRSARVANVFVGAAIVLLTGLIGRQVFNGAAGLLAAALVAIVPLSVDTSTVVRNDPGMVLAVVAAVCLALAALEREDSRWMAAAGVLAGVAAGIKYSAVFAVAPVLIAAAARGTPARRVRRTLLALAGCAIAIAVTNHFVWADFPNFLKQLADQVSITGRGHWAATDDPAGFYVKILDRFGPGAPLLLLATAFAVFALAIGRARHLVFVSFPLLYLWFMTHRPSQFPRWVFPMVPFVAIAGAGALDWLLRTALARVRDRSPRWSRPAGVLAAVVAVAVLWPALSAGAVSFSRRVTPPTHALAEAWLRRVPKGTVVLAGAQWLDLRSTDLVVRRVPDLGAALQAGGPPIAQANLVVVPEPDFANPGLKSLILVRTFHAKTSFGGNLGYDYRIYAVPQTLAGLR